LYVFIHKTPKFALRATKGGNSPPSEVQQLSLLAARRHSETQEGRNDTPESRSCDWPLICKFSSASVRRRFNDLTSFLGFIPHHLLNESLISKNDFSPDYIVPGFIAGETSSAP
jgi:hypothetical protein